MTDVRRVSVRPHAAGCGWEVVVDDPDGSHALMTWEEHEQRQTPIHFQDLFRDLQEPLMHGMIMTREFLQFAQIDLGGFILHELEKITDGEIDSVVVRPHIVKPTEENSGA